MQTEQILAQEYGEGAVEPPKRATFYRLVNNVARNNEPFGSATVHRQRALRPAGPFTSSMAARPGEIVQIDSTRLDVMAALDDGVVARPRGDHRGRCHHVDDLGAALLRPAGTKGVDAALLLARMLVPEPMRPGWSQTLAMADSILPHERLMAIDTRLEQAAAKPVIIPDTIVIDHGKVFVSDTFSSACSLLGISLQLARPRTPTDKAIVERTFASINSLFCQYVAGYTGSDVTRRGSDPAAEAVWTLAQLQDLLDEWIICWQQRPHEGLRNPYMPGRTLSPNESYAIAVARAGYLPVALSAEEYIELLPVVWRAINDYGVKIGYRTYDSPELNRLRRQPSGVNGQAGSVGGPLRPLRRLSHLGTAKRYPPVDRGHLDPSADGPGPLRRLHLAPRASASCRSRQGRHERDLGRAGPGQAPAPVRETACRISPGAGPHPGRHRRVLATCTPARPGRWRDGPRQQRRGDAGHPVRRFQPPGRGWTTSVVIPPAVPDDEHNPLTTKDGWRRLVDDTPTCPQLLSPRARAPWSCPLRPAP
ncbi:hypothetical protein OOK36_54815 [Streptomyces sp. NBC_00365]|uniref:hypothetical protein n=1 Tax=Streptomyces sp. NBC_00365 TaxID=2975726 RepID=UPI00224CC0FC|nr:hypothetical protein [Streptomyces sp. NBC_00365]MCX5097542.1 hypothetical protein [Streptomyces sp. NBC_00365]